MYNVLVFVLPHCALCSTLFTTISTFIRRPIEDCIGFSSTQTDSLFARVHLEALIHHLNICCDFLGADFPNFLLGYLPEVLHVMLVTVDSIWLVILSIEENSMGQFY